MTKYKPNTSIFGMSNTIDVCPTGYDYEQYQLNELVNENMKLKKQLEIAIKALKEISHWSPWKDERDERASIALKEMEGVK